MLTDAERAELARLREIERAEEAEQDRRRDAQVAAVDARGDMWSEGPPPPPPRPPRVAAAYGVNERGEILVDARKTRDELIEESFERDPVSGELRRW